MLVFDMFIIWLHTLVTNMNKTGTIPPENDAKIQKINGYCTVKSKLVIACNLQNCCSIFLHTS